MLAGRMMPCQCSEVGSSRRLRTRRVTVSPSRQRSTGPGKLLLMVSAVRGRPVMLTGVWPMNSSKSRPLSSLPKGEPAAKAGRRQRPSPARVLAAAKPLTKVRRVGFASMGGANP
ncbi:hypothetical protein D3C79_859980 [compost metagenome]